MVKVSVLLQLPPLQSTEVHREEAKKEIPACKSSFCGSRESKRPVEHRVRTHNTQQKRVAASA